MFGTHAVMYADGLSMSQVEYIIIQAGGLGSRLKHLTVNKPKAIVSINNLPMIFHLFRKFPDKHFIIIGDYKKEVLDKYLMVFANVKYLTVDTDGHKGTCSGISKAIEFVPPGERFMLIWSDLVLGPDFKFPTDCLNYLGISGTFLCRWSYKDNEFTEESSYEDGVAGLFIFNDKKIIENVPDSGEFVKWLQGMRINFKRLILADTVEYGLLEKIKPLEYGKCRPFNSLTVKDGVVIKEGIDDQGRSLAVREKNWYKHVMSLGVSIPEIFSFEPLSMEAIDGCNIFEYRNLPEEQKRIILKSIMEELNTIHSHDCQFVDRFSMNKAYFMKTFDRLSKIRDLVPFANDKIIKVNGKNCRNVFYHIDEVRKRVSMIKCDHFSLIHGDCTFSNIMLKQGKKPVFIDPRGYFGDCELIGDPNYDWSKLYYSVVGNYDMFNLGRFKLIIGESSVELEIDSNGWENMEDTFINNLPSNICIEDVVFIHALIWLSLTTYAWDDYDSICGAFYNGIYYLEDTL